MRAGHKDYMGIILGERFYEKTDRGVYPKYNLRQLKIYADPECYPYTVICTMENVLCFDLFGKYMDEITEDQKMVVDNELKKHYGLVVVDADALIDHSRYEYRDNDLGYKEWFDLANPTESEG